MTPKRVDANQRAIVDGLRKLGVSVCCIHEVGNGCPDLLVGSFGKNYLLELKDPSQPPSRRDLTPDERKFHEDWRGQVAVAHDLDEAIAVIFEGYQ